MHLPPDGSARSTARTGGAAGRERALNRRATLRAAQPRERALNRRRHHLRLLL